MQKSTKKNVPYVWSSHYRAAICELDSQKILAELNNAETSIQRRRSELLRNLHAADSQELADITRALQTLTQLREIEQYRAGQPS